MLLHQPCNEIAVCGAESVGFAETERIRLAEFGMVTAATFSDIVEQSGEIEQFGPVKLAHQPAAQRELVGQFRNCKAPQVAHDFQDVLVDGIDVVKIMLHLADNTAESRDVTSQNVVLVHAPQFTDHTRRAAQDFHELLTHPRIAACCGVDAASRAPECAQRECANSLDFAMLLHQRKRLKDGAGIALENGFVRR